MEKGLQRILNDVNVAIVKATRRNDNKALKDLLIILKNIIIVDPELEGKYDGVDSALLISARQGNYKNVKKLLKSGAQKFNVALKLAILNNRYEAAQLLVQAMMEDNQPLYDFFTLAVEKCPDSLIADYISLAMNETGEVPYDDDDDYFDDCALDGDEAFIDYLDSFSKVIDECKEKGSSYFKGLTGNAKVIFDEVAPTKEKIDEARKRAMDATAKITVGILKFLKDGKDTLKDQFEAFEKSLKEEMEEEEAFKKDDDDSQKSCVKDCLFDDVEYPSNDDVKKMTEKIMNKQAKKMEKFVDELSRKGNKADKEDSEKKDKFPDLGSLSWDEIEELAEKIAEKQERMKEEFIKSCLSDENDSGDSKK